MSNFQRLIAIPQEEYLALSSMQNVKEPMAQHFYNLEKRYNNEESVRDPYRRMMMQSSTLDQIKQVKEQMRNSLAVSTPKPYQSRANALFQTIESFLKFNDKGEIYSSDDADVIIPNSRVEDLIQHAVRDRRRNMTPTGWSDFLAMLRNHNVPKSILNRDTLDEMEGKATPSLNNESVLPTIKVEPEEVMQTRERRLQPGRQRKPTIEDLSFLKHYKKK